MESRSKRQQAAFIIAVAWWFNACDADHGTTPRSQDEDVSAPACRGGELLNLDAGEICFGSSNSFACPDRLPVSVVLEGVLICFDQLITADVINELEDHGVVPRLPAVCVEIEAEYRLLIEESKQCFSDFDCRAVGGNCLLGSQDCWAYTNRFLNEEDILAVNHRFEDSDCSRAPCGVCPPASTVACVDGRCQGYGQPLPCSNVEPVCARNSAGNYQSYDSECGATQDGAQPLHLGSCKACDNSSPSGCAVGEQCVAVDSWCGTSMQEPHRSGVCIPAEITCSLDRPACGCDGNTYSDICGAIEAAGGASKYGGCTVEDGWTCIDSTCSDNQFCVVSSADTWGQPYHGRCHDFPTDCPGGCGCVALDWDPLSCAEVGGRPIVLSPGG